MLNQLMIQSHTLSLASSITTEFPRTTTIPISFLDPSFLYSTDSSITRFINGSNPLRTPSTARPPLILRWIYTKEIENIDITFMHRLVGFQLLLKHIIQGILFALTLIPYSINSKYFYFDQGFSENKYCSQIQDRLE